MARATPTIRTRVMWQKTETNTEGEAQAEKRELGTADIIRILKLLPHRYPFLLVDKIVDMDGDSSAVGIKNVTINEPFFQGHFPNFPVMPGVLLIEGMAQTAGALCVANLAAVLRAAARLLHVDRPRAFPPPCSARRYGALSHDQKAQSRACLAFRRESEGQRPTRCRSRDQRDDRRFGAGFLPLPRERINDP